MAIAVNEDELQLKKRARRRLVGAVVLVLIAFLLLPRVLEHQPKPVQKDVAIQLPLSVEPAKPITPPPPIAGLPQGDAPKTSEPVAPLKEPAAAKTVEPPAAKMAEPPAAKTAERPPVRVEKPAAKPAAVAKESKSPPPTAQEFDVQLGAFSKAENATRLMQKLKDAHFNAFAETVKTGNATKTRVRAGPYPSREAADKARSKLIALKLIVGEPRVVRHQ